jgi:type IV pilus assembly protein PilA
VYTTNIKNTTNGTATGGIVSLRPLKSAGTALANSDFGVSIFAWRCGSSTDGTTVDAKFLPGSCRGN